MAKRERITDFKVQRPIDYDEKAILKCIEQYGYVLVDIKHDGIRGILNSATGPTLAVTRENIEILSVTHRLSTIAGLDFPLDTELVIPGIPFEEASGLLRRHSPLPAEYPLHIYVFDMIDTGARERWGCERRKAALDGVSLLGLQTTGDVQVHWVQSSKAASLAEIKALYDAARAAGYEGVVIKNPGQHYTPNKVQGWWKLKPSETVDGIVTAFVMGEEGKANEGKVVGFVVKLEDGSTCKATGFTRQLIHEVTSNPGSYKGRYVEVSRMEATDGGASRHPSFVRFRDIEGAEGIKA